MHRIYIEYLLVPVIPFMLGGYCVYAATRTCQVLKVKTAKNQRRKLSLASIEKSNELNPFIAFISSKLTGKVQVDA